MKHRLDALQRLFPVGPLAHVAAHEFGFGRHEGRRLPVEVHRRQQGIQDADAVAAGQQQVHRV